MMADASDERAKQANKPAQAPEPPLLVLHLPQKHHLPLWVARLFRDVALQALELVECVAR